MAQGKTVGLVLMAAGVVILIVAGLFFASGVASGQLQASGAVLGLAFFGILPLLVLGGAGFYLYQQGQAEASLMADVQRKQRILGLIQSQGQASLEGVMLELKLTREQLTTDIAELVQQGLFTGYIDWKKLTFYSSDAAKVGSATCPNCGATRETVGKGVTACPYCGATLFIPAN
jgi:ribosomal protein S27AE